jgi:PAS domain-containing protein
MSGDGDPIVICEGPKGAFRVLYANAAFGDLTARPLEETFGRSFLLAIGGLGVGDERESLQAALSVPRPICLSLHLGPPHGSRQPFELAACPAPPEAVAPVVWVVRLRGQGPRAGPVPSDLAFVDDLAVGLVLFDADDRLVWFNGTYRRVLGANAQLLKLGERFEDIMAAAYRAGHAAGDATEVERRIAERLARHRARETFEEALSGGRWLLVREIATAEGGTLGVRTDITEAKQGGGSPTGK